MLDRGTGFSGCNMRSDKTYAHLVPEWSNDPEKRIVVSVAPCTFWEYTISKILVCCVAKVARFLIARNGGQ